MSDDMLSQEEIDALLNNDSAKKLDQYLTVIEQDALGEIGNISFGSASTALSTLLNQKVDITTPELSLILRSQLAEEFPHPHVAIIVKYTEGFQGENVMVIKEDDAQIIADLMLGGDGTNPSNDLGDIQLSAVQEAMNQMMGSASTSMSTIFGKRVDISPPSIQILNVSEGEGTDQIPPDESLVKVSFSLKVGELIDSKIMQILPVGFAKEMVGELLSAKADEPKSDEAKQSVANFSEERKKDTDHRLDQFERTDDRPSDERNTKGIESISDQRSANVQPVAFSDFEDISQPAVETKNLDLLLDIPLQITVELGRTNRAIRDILEFSAGSIVELDKLAGEPVDILVNNKRIAKGEVVVIDENFGVRVTEIISQKERIKNLQ